MALHDDYFSRTAPDQKWITEVGRRGWIAVTGDNAITRDPLALHHLSRSSLYLFVLLGLNGASPEGKAECIRLAYGKMVAHVQASEPPQIWRIGKDGKVRIFDFRHTLTRMQRRR